MRLFFLCRPAVSSAHGENKGKIYITDIQTPTYAHAFNTKEAGNPEIGVAKNGQYNLTNKSSLQFVFFLNGTMLAQIFSISYLTFMLPSIGFMATT